MANRADGTDGKGKPSLSKSQVSGKSTGDFGHTASRSMPSGKTVSGKEEGSYGTKGAKNVGKTHFPRGSNEDHGQVSHDGGKF